MPSARDRERARDAWRRNLPEKLVVGRQAELLIPIKGSIEGAAYRATEKPPGIVVTLPHAVPMIVMPFYSLKWNGFRQLWLKMPAPDNGADAERGSELRVVFDGAKHAVVGINDLFVSVAVERPCAARPRLRPSGEV